MSLIMSLKKSWKEFMFDRTKFDVVWDISCFIAVIAAFVLMFFAPATVFVQWLFMVYALFVVFVPFIFIFSDADIYMAREYDIHKFWGWCALASAILWMFPISIFWSLIPIGLGILVQTLIDDDEELLFGNIILSTLFIAMLFGVSAPNLNSKWYLLSNLKSEEVVLSNYDKSSSVFFIESEDSYLMFDNYKVRKTARELDFKKADTVKIVRHPNSSHLVIKVSR